MSAKEMFEYVGGDYYKYSDCIEIEFNSFNQLDFKISFNFENKSWNISCIAKNMVQITFVKELNDAIQQQIKELGW